MALAGLLQLGPRQPQAVRGGDALEAVLARLEEDALRAGDRRAEGVRVQLESAAVKVLPEGKDLMRRSTGDPSA